MLPQRNVIARASRSCRAPVTCSTHTRSPSMAWSSPKGAAQRSSPLCTKCDRCTKCEAAIDSIERDSVQAATVVLTTTAASHDEGPFCGRRAAMNTYSRRALLGAGITSAAAIPLARVRGVNYFCLCGRSHCRRAHVRATACRRDRPRFRGARRMRPRVDSVLRTGVVCASLAMLQAAAGWAAVILAGCA